MKKFFVPLFFLLLFSCSNDGFESQVAASSQKSVWCMVDGECLQISKSLCSEKGTEYAKGCSNISSSSDDESSSSSEYVDDSSSSEYVDDSSSSGSGSSSSSSGGSSSSSSDGVVISSSSAGVVVSSSSDGVVVSSSSDGAVVSSSSDGVVVSSSSSVDDGSSSSVGTSSSSSATISSSSSASLGACSAFPYYVAKTKKEYIKNLVPSNGCGNVTYSVSSTGGGGPGGGNNIASITSSGDSISFVSASSANSNTERSLTIRATSASCGYKDCTITVFIADDYRAAKCNHKDIFDVNLNNIKSTTTVIEYACCESKSDYFLTCGGVNYSLKVHLANIPTKNSSGGNANLPALETIPEPGYAKCDVAITDPDNPSDPPYPIPRGILYHYPERVLMTLTTSSSSSGGFSCNSW